MRTRTPGLLLVLISLLLGAVGSLVAVASTSERADACSIAGPYGEVWPSADLRPGQQIDITGWSFVDVRLHAPEPQAVAPPDGGTTLRPPLCDFDIFPLDTMRVVWQGPGFNGEISESLGVVAGPEFRLSAIVPVNASTGPANIIVGPVTLGVYVGPVVEPPRPCPLGADRAAVASQDCPEPWPCPVYATGAAGTEPAPDQRPEFWPPCPEPCVDYAHANPDGTEHDFRWDCPDPCGYDVSPPEAASNAVWCPPPPDPCPVYAHADGAVDAQPAVVCPDPCGYDVNQAQSDGETAVWCPPPPCPLAVDGAGGASHGCPEPCPNYARPNVEGTEYDSRWDCPDPCGVVGEDAVWCPPPPDPCPVYVQGDRAVDSDELIWCPDPCGVVVGEDAVWCPPPPCTDYGDADAHVCPTPVPAARQAAPTGPATESAPAISPVEPAPPIAPAESAPAVAPIEFVPASAATETAPTTAAAELGAPTGPDVAGQAAPVPVAADGLAAISTSSAAAVAVASLVRHMVAIVYGILALLF